MVEIARQELKIPEDDPRDLTISGGLSFFGGPFNNYSMHAIVSAVNLIREKNSLKIMILANGGYNTKQSIGIYGMEPPALSWNNRDDTAVQQQIFANELPEPIEKADGLLTIEAYTIKYDRSGNPTEGIVIGRLENGSRTLAIIEADPNVLLKLEHEELVGKSFKVYYNSHKDRNLICI
jgi:acetyl-CoA C-acetyltransferase